MDEREFKRRTKQLALDVIVLVEGLPTSTTRRVIATQLLRSATSVGANYRASCRGRSVEEIIAKLSIVEEVGDETMYWLELLQEARLAPTAAVGPIWDQANQVVAMVVASKKTLKARIHVKSFANPAIVNRES